MTESHRIMRNSTVNVREPAILFAVYMAPGIVAGLGGSSVSIETATLIALILRNGAFGLLVLYLMDLGGDRSILIGAGGIHRTVRISIGVAVLLVTLAALIRLVFAFLPGVSTVPNFSEAVPGEPFSLVLLGFAVVVAAYVEELFFRAYLLTRLRRAGLSSFLVITAGALAFALGHSWQGVEAILFSGFAGIALGILWTRTMNYQGLALGHALYNITVLLIAHF